jgi:hypothetical protein
MQSAKNCRKRVKSIKKIEAGIESMGVDSHAGLQFRALGIRRSAHDKLTG